MRLAKRPPRLVQPPGYGSGVSRCSRPFAYAPLRAARSGGVGVAAAAAPAAAAPPCRTTEFDGRHSRGVKADEP
eukprot:gene3970-biopygen11376